MNANFLQGAGLLLCIGGIVLAGLVLFGISRAFGSRNSRPIDRDSQDVFSDRGSERPRYDSDEVESSGGFGNAPRGSRPSSAPPRQRSSEPDLDDRLRGNLGDETPRAPRPRRQDSDDDPDIRSGGGFGG